MELPVSLEPAVFLFLFTPFSLLTTYLIGPLTVLPTLFHLGPLKLSCPLFFSGIPTPPTLTLVQ